MRRLPLRLVRHPPFSLFPFCSSFSSPLINSSLAKNTSTLLHFSTDILESNNNKDLEGEEEEVREQEERPLAQIRRQDNVNKRIYIDFEAEEQRYFEEKREALEHMVKTGMATPDEKVLDANDYAPPTFSWFRKLDHIAILKDIQDTVKDFIKGEALEHYEDVNQIQAHSPIISFEVKHKLWKTYQEDPQSWTTQALADRFNLDEGRVKAILSLKELESKAPYDPEADRRAEILEILAEHNYMVSDHEMPAEIPSARALYEIYPQHFAPEDFDPRTEEGWIHPLKKVRYKIPEDEIPLIPILPELGDKTERDLAKMTPPVDDKGYIRSQGTLIVLLDDETPNAEVPMFVSKGKFTPAEEADAMTRWRFFNMKYPNLGRRFDDPDKIGWWESKRPAKYIRPPRFLTPRPIPHDIDKYLRQYNPEMFQHELFNRRPTQRHKKPFTSHF